MQKLGGFLSIALAAVALAGCVTAPDPTTDHALGATADGAADDSAFALAAEGCREGGGHSVHPKFLNPLPDPWVPADVIADVGPQLAYSEIPDPGSPIPSEGNTIGNFHSTVFCESWTFDGQEKKDLVFGYVGMKVEGPSFGDDAPTHNYLVTVIATNDDDVYAALNAAGFHAMKATSSLEDVDGQMLRVRMSTDHNGEYDSLFRPKALGDMNAPHVRLWFQRDNGDGTYSPVALDMRNEGGQHFGAEAQGYFSHSGTHHHAPLPGAYGHTAALWWEGHDKSFSLGPRAEDVRLAGYYDH